MDMTTVLLVVILLGLVLTLLAANVLRRQERSNTANNESTRTYLSMLGGGLSGWVIVSMGYVFIKGDTHVLGSPWLGVIFMTIGWYGLVLGSLAGLLCSRTRPRNR